MEKICISCKKLKPLEEFYKHPKMADGHLNQCKECKRAYQQKIQATPEGRERDRRRYRSQKRQDWTKKYIEENRERINSRRREWASRNPEKVEEARQRTYARLMLDDDRRKRYNKKKKEWRKKNWEKVLGYYRKTTKKALKDVERKEKLYSRAKVWRAKKSGKLEIGDCVVCGSTAQAHHNDYKKPLDVVWYCREHHSTFHYLLRLITT